MTTTGIINKILNQSFVDGPGNRAVIFLQGCTFNCLYCHNPYTVNMCKHCRECVSVCPSRALKVVDRKVVWLPDRCDECDMCITACPHGSSPRTRRMTTQEVWEELKPLSPFLSGVTVSGGEATLQMDFLIELFTLIKSESNLTTCIETNGCLTTNRMEKLLPVLDFALVDLKADDPVLHHALTGGDNAFVKETIRYLSEQGKLHAVRQVVVPGYTDTEANAAGTARFLAGIDPAIPLEFLRFRPHGTIGAAASWESPTDEVMARMVAAAEKEGLEKVQHSM